MNRSFAWVGTRLVAMCIVVACDVKQEATPIGDGGLPKLISVGSGASTTSTIGPSGGTVSLESAHLDIPAGALDREQTIRVTSTTSTGPSDARRYSTVYQFEPSGLVFKTPASVTLSMFDVADDMAIYWSSSDGTTWERLDGLVTPRAGITAKVSHFSMAFVGDKNSSFAGLTGGTTSSGGTSSGSTSSGSTSSGSTSSGGTTCGATYTTGCFGCYQTACNQAFLTTFGPSSQSGTFEGPCSTYGKCICTCTSPEDCKKCIFDPACSAKSEQSGLFTCASAKCASACGG